MSLYACQHQVRVTIIVVLFVFRILQLKMISSNSFSSSSTTSSLSSGTDGKDHQMCFDDPKSFQTQNNLDGDFPMLTISEMSEKDERYWERRRKNNAAAKRSRERRRQHDVAMEKQIQNLKLANALLKNEFLILQQRLSSHTPSMENSEMPSPITNQQQNYFQVEDISSLLTGNITGSAVNHSSQNTILPTSLQIMSSKCINGFPREISDQISVVQNPLDLSLKVKTEFIPLLHHSNSSRANSRSHSEASNLDQRYWDRRRRNNEAVRKCRQNKKVKMQSNANSNTNNNNNNNAIVNNNNNNVDKLQINTKIESISNELEKLKSQLQHSEIVSNTDRSMKCPIKLEETVPNFSQRINFNDDCKKTIKWKNRLIEANQAEK